nr:hypothetical protein [Megavirus caiporensis]
MIINIEASLIYFCMLFSTIIITPIFYYVYRITRDIVASYCQRQFVNQCAKIFKENEAIVKHTVYSILDIASNIENHTNNYFNNSLLYKFIGLSCEKIVDIFKTYVSNYNTCDLYNNTISPINNASIFDHVDKNINNFKPTTPIYNVYDDNYYSNYPANTTCCNPVGDYCVQTNNYCEAPVLAPFTCEKTINKISDLNKQYNTRSKNRSGYRNRRIRFRPFESRKKTNNDSILNTPVSEVSNLSNVSNITSPVIDNKVQNTVDNMIDSYYSKCIDKIDLVGINPNCQDEYKNKLKNCLDMLKNPETNPSDYINHVMESFGFDKKDASVQSLLKMYGLDKYTSDSETDNVSINVSDSVNDNVSEYIDEISDKVTIESEESDNE